MLAVVSALYAWTWAGASIAPPQHRRLALGLFSVPVVLLTVVVLAIVTTAIAVGAVDEVPPETFAFTVGCVLACGGIPMLHRNMREALPSHRIKRIVLTVGSITFLAGFLGRFLSGF